MPIIFFVGDGLDAFVMPFCCGLARRARLKSVNAIELASLSIQSFKQILNRRVIRRITHKYDNKFFY
jgi:hypothetical protein